MQCNPSVFSLDQKIHGLFNFYGLNIDEGVKDVSKLLLISFTVITQNKFELKSVTQLSLVCVTDFTIEKLPRNSNFCV